MIMLIVLISYNTRLFRLVKSDNKSAFIYKIFTHHNRHIFELNLNFLKIKQYLQYYFFLQIIYIIYKYVRCCQNKI